MEIEVGLFFTALGGVIGFLGWMAGRDKTLSKDAEWRGGVNAKLDMILQMQQRMQQLEHAQKGLESRLSAVENSVKSAHHRLDEFA